MKKQWNKWKFLAKKIGDFQINLIFSFLYFFIITPIGIFVKFSTNYFKINKNPSWEKFEGNTNKIRDLKNQ